MYETLYSKFYEFRFYQQWAVFRVRMLIMGLNVGVTVCFQTVFKILF